MKILALHCDYLKYKTLKKALKKVDELGEKPGQGDIKEPLVIFTAIEKQDKDHKEYVKNIREIAKQVNPDNIVIYPYAHLSSNLGSPEIAVKILKDAEKTLAKDFKVSRAPFGYYKQFEFRCKGHPLAELSRSIGEDGEVSEDIGGHSLEAKMETATHLVYETARKMIDQEFISISEVKGNKSVLNWSRFKNKIEDKFIHKLEKEANKNLESNLPVKIENLNRKKALDKCGQFYDEVIPKKFKEVRVVSIGDLPPEPCIKPHVSKTREINGNISIEGFEKVGKEAYKIKISIKELNEKNKEEEADLSKEEKKRLLNMMTNISMTAPTGEKGMKSNVTLGRELDLYVVSEIVGKGLPLLTPKGTTIKREIERFVIDEELKRGYLHTSTPIMAKSDLYKISGHWQHYKDSMFDLEIGGDTFALRPMTCPFQFILYKSRPRSYRELPVKYAEIASLFRSEQSGELRGLTRVRQFTLADGHIICRPENLEKEFEQVMDLINFLMEKLSMKDIWYRFSKWDPKDKKGKYINNPKAWESSQKAMKKILNKLKIKYTEEEGEAAFYGPKLDIQYKDIYGKEDTLITVQIDFALPERYDLTFKDEKGKEVRPMVIHRSSSGATERVIAYLLEKYQGRLPTWLSPVQVKLLSFTERNIKAVEKFAQELKEQGIRTEIDIEEAPMGGRIREAETQKIPLIVVIGDKEEKAKELAVRKNNKVTNIKKDKFVKDLLKEIQDRA